MSRRPRGAVRIKACIGLTDRRSSKSSTSEADSSDAETHKNEGFLKNIWHTLTNHPAHQKDAQGQSGAAKEDTKEGKSNDERKKSSESGSG